MDAHLPRPFSPSKTREFQTDLLGVLLFSAVAFNFIDSPVLRCFLLKWVPGLKTLPTRQTLSGPVLDRLVTDCVAAAKVIYLKGCYITMSMDGWKSRAGRKLMGILCSNVGSADGRVAADFRGTTDITTVSESATLVQHELESEMAKGVETGDWALPLASGGLSTDTASAVVGVVSDSASANVGAKRALSLLHPSIIFVACLAHQLNLLTGSVIGHESLRAITTKCSLIVSFFKRSTKYMGLLLEIMDATMKNRLTFIKTGETRWYSHYGQARRLLDLKPALERLANDYYADTTLLRTTNGAAVVDELRSRSFWGRLEVVTQLLLLMVKEIGLVERRDSNLADAAAAFGRLHAFYSQLGVDSATLGTDGATALAPVFVVSADPSVRVITNQLCMTILKLLQWRFTRYFSADLLLLAHILDPSRGVAGLCTRPGCYAAYDNIVRLFLGLAFRFGALPQGSGQGELQQNRRRQAVAGVVKYLADGPDTLLLFDPKGGLVVNNANGGGVGCAGGGGGDGDRDRVAALVMWSLCPEYKGTVLQQVALRLFAGSCHAAELERVWSAMGLANSTTRSQLGTKRLTDMTRVALHLRAQNVKDKKQTFQPGSYLETAVDESPVNGDVEVVQGAEGGCEETGVGQDDDGDRLAATGAALQQQLQEEQDTCRRAGEPLPGEGTVDEVGRTAGPAAFSDEDLRAMYDNLMHGRRDAGGGGGPADAARDGAAVAACGTRPRVLLSSLFDAEWYLKDAKATYGL